METRPQAMWTPGHAEGDVRELTGLHERGDTTAADAVLRRAVERSLTMVCVNPDRVTVSPSGVLTYVPGQLAARYEELGGSVHYFGKPYAGAYSCIALLRVNL